MTTNVRAHAAGAFEHGVLTPVDIADAMDLLAAAANDPSRDCVLRPVSTADTGYGASRYTLGGEPRGIIGHVLSMAGAAVADLASMRDHSLRDLYSDGRLPIAITLGALIVLDAAQRSQDRGSQLEDVLDDATAAAARFLDLVAILPAVSRRVDPSDALPDFRPRVHEEPSSSQESSCGLTHAL
jgi:hypothetical protein